MNIKDKFRLSASKTIAKFSVEKCYITKYNISYSTTTGVVSKTNNDQSDNVNFVIDDNIEKISKINKNFLLANKIIVVSGKDLGSHEGLAKVGAFVNFADLSAWKIVARSSDMYGATITLGLTQS